MDADRFKYGDVQHFQGHLKLIVHFGWCFFSVLGLEIYAMMEVKMLTERFIMVLNVFKGFSSPVYVAPWAMLGTESNSLVGICGTNMLLLVTFRLGLLDRSQMREIILTMGIKKEAT